MKTHKMSKTKTYISWSRMRARCGKRKGYESIYICEKWKKFEGFLEDMGIRPEGKTLDRIDSKKGYELKNCKWSTSKEQNRNKKNNVILNWNNNNITLSDFLERTGIPRDYWYSKKYRCNGDAKLILFERIKSKMKVF